MNANDEVRPMWIERKLGPYWGLILVGAVLVPIFIAASISNYFSERQVRQFLDNPTIQEIAKEHATRTE